MKICSEAYDWTICSLPLTADVSSPKKAGIEKGRKTRFNGLKTPRPEKQNLSVTCISFSSLATVGPHFLLHHSLSLHATWCFHCPFVSYLCTKLATFEMSPIRQQKRQWIASPNIKPSDVLLGRGSGANNRRGNLTFRQFIKRRKAEYIATKNRETKSKIAKEIVANLRQTKGARFLRKATVADARSLGIPFGVEAWCIVDERSILEKAKQALRQKAEWKDLPEDELDQDTSSNGHSVVPPMTQSHQQDAVTIISPEATPSHVPDQEDLLKHLPLLPDAAYSSSKAHDLYPLPPLPLVEEDDSVVAIDWRPTDNYGCHEAILESDDLFVW